MKSVLKALTPVGPNLVATAIILMHGSIHAEPAERPISRVVAWGDIKYDLALPLDARPATPNGLAEVAAGDFHSLVLRSDGSVVAWGDNTFGQSSVPIL